MDKDINMTEVFWEKVMPLSVQSYSWSKEMEGFSKEKQWTRGIKAKLQDMDMAEFDLFMAGVVMTAAKKQVMGVDLTSKIELFRELRGK